MADPEIRGFMPEFPDDVFDDEDKSHVGEGYMQSPEEGTDDHSVPLSLVINT